jgi:hypothetical protein
MRMVFRLGWAHSLHGNILFHVILGLLLRLMVLDLGALYWRSQRDGLAVKISIPYCATLLLHHLSILLAITTFTIHASICYVQCLAPNHDAWICISPACVHMAPRHMLKSSHLKSVADVHTSDFPFVPRIQHITTPSLSLTRMDCDSHPHHSD